MRCCHDNGKKCIKRGARINVGKSARDAAAGVTRTRTHHAVVVDELQLVVGQDVAPVVDQVQRHLRRGQARLAAGPAAAHGEQGADVELLLPCRRPRPEEEEEKAGERQPEQPRSASGNQQHGSRWAEPGRAGPSRVHATRNEACQHVSAAFKQPARVCGRLCEATIYPQLKSPFGAAAESI